MITGLEHAAFKTDSIEAAVHFYCVGLGLYCRQQRAGDAIIMAPDKFILEPSLPDKDASAVSDRENSVITHICFNTYDVDTAFKRALEFGAVPSREDNPAPYTYKNLRMAFILTPSGEEIELWSIQRADGSFSESAPQGKYVKHVVHCALKVPDINACIGFYEGLGLKLKTKREWGCSLSLPDGRELELFAGGERCENKHGYVHLCLLTDDVDSDVEKAVSLGGKIADPPYDWSNLRISFVIGLAGEVIEFFQIYNDGRQADVFDAFPGKLPDLFAEAEEKI